MEAVIKYDSMLDANRAKEAIEDFIKNIFRGFSLGVIGKHVVTETTSKEDMKLEDTQALTSAYAYAIALVLKMYESQRVLTGMRGRISAMLGIAPSAKQIELADNRTIFLPLVHTVLQQILEADFSLLLTRWKACASSQEFFCLISHILLVLLTEMPCYGSPNIGLNFNKTVYAFSFANQSDDALRFAFLPPHLFDSLTV